MYIFFLMPIKSICSVLESIDGVFVPGGDIHVPVEHPFKAKTCDKDGGEE